MIKINEKLLSLITIGWMVIGTRMKKIFKTHVSTAREQKKKFPMNLIVARPF